MMILPRRSPEAEHKAENRLLTAVNRILETAVDVDSAEALRIACLSVAEEVTGSTVAFIGEIGEDGLFHDIAVSNPAWAHCTMRDPQGRRRSPAIQRVQGLCGRVLKDGITLLTNDPGGHPGSTGLPDGHPLLTSLLGVPLKDGHKVIGMVAVANRQGGYGPDEQAALETLAAAMSQALRRHKAEDALRESEACLRALVDNLPFDFWAMNRSGRYTVANAVSEGAWGARVGKRPEDIAPDADVLHKWRENNRRAFAGEVVTAEVNYLRGGQEGTFHNIIAPVRVKNEIRGILGVNIDVTDRKRAEDALRELNENLERHIAERTAEVNHQAEQLRALASELSRVELRERQRLAKILHDHIQQLIAVAKMRIESLKELSDLDRIRAASEGIYATLDKALEALRSLTVELSPPVLHEAGLIGGLNWLAARMQAEHQFSLRLKADAGAEPAAEETRFLLFECVRELVMNVVKHAGVTAAAIALVRRRNDQIGLIFQDGGKGFDPRVLEKRHAGEASFGLFSIQERLVHLGGRMDIESAPGRGTRVTLTVPDAVDDHAAAREAESSPRADRAERIKLRGKPEGCRVLIVDDHQILREGLVSLFEFQRGIQVVGEAADGAQAIRLAEELEPDVIIMDVNLGAGMDGIEATRRILAKDPLIRVIGLSMHNDENVAGAMRDAGAKAYLTKGGPLEDLIAAIRGYCVT